MTTFPDTPRDDYAVIYLEDTDRPLPARVDPNTRYAYFKTIAKGGKSVIQSCKDLHLGRTICYKSLRKELAADPTEQCRFLREARITAMLQHPNTVPTYEVGRDRDGYYFTMKLVHGYTLREVLDFRERYDLRQLIDVVIQVGHALDYAHSHRVIHRDIKPENVLVGPFGEVLLLDWGLAKVWGKDGVGIDVEPESMDLGGGPASSMTGAGPLQGTPMYMSPEQLRKDPRINFKSDIYSLGVVLYEVLAGQLPHAPKTFDDLLAQVGTVVPPAPSAVSPFTVPPLLDQLAMACVAPVPEDRPPSCREIVRLLQEEW